MNEIEKLMRKGIGNLKPYVPGKSEEEIREIYNVSPIVKLASNENPLALPGSVLTAIVEEAPRIHRYPDGKCRRLAARLARFLGCQMEELIFGNGAEELILMVCQAFINEGDPCVLVSHTFDAYETAVRIMGGQPVFSPLNGEYRVNLRDVLRRITPETKLVFLPNPNNPTGTIFTRDDFEWFLQNLPGHTVVVLDEAYHEYVTDPLYPDGKAYLGINPPLLVLRTFSKAYGLAGVRIGYALAHPAVIEALHRVRLPFNVNRLAEMAALAALEQQEWVRRGCRMVNEEKAFLYRALREMGIFYVPSETNFIFMDVGVDVDRLCKDLLSEGIIVRPGTIWGFKTFLRLTVGTHQENKRFLTHLRAGISPR